MARQVGKSLVGLKHLRDELKAGETVYIGTKNKLWFLARFKDATGEDAEFTRTIQENLYQIKLKKK